jgi:ORF6N domain
MKQTEKRMTLPDISGPMIRIIRGYRIILDTDLARIYGVSTKRLNQQAQRNIERFPDDFMFRLTAEELDSLRLQSATSKHERGGRRFAPFAFTEHGAIMVSAVLRTPIAVLASIQIARAFARMRHLLSTHHDLSRKLEEFEKKTIGHDAAIMELVEAIRSLMEPPEEPVSKIGYKP